MGSFRKPLESGGGTGEPFPSSNWSKAGPIVPAVPVNPATSINSVGGSWACAISKRVTNGSFGRKRVVPSGGGNVKPFELSKGLPDGANNRLFHISPGKKATLIAAGVRR